MARTAPAPKTRGSRSSLSVGAGKRRETFGKRGGRQSQRRRIATILLVSAKGGFSVAWKP